MRDDGDDAEQGLSTLRLQQLSRLTLLGPSSPPIAMTAVATSRSMVDSTGQNDNIMKRTEVKHGLVVCPSPWLLDGSECRQRTRAKGPHP
jgi:hypothetical protein